MNPHLILLPILAHVFLVLMLYILLVQRKIKAKASGNVDLKQTALNNHAWTDDVVKVSNNITNQFETPVLFYVLCLSLLASASVSMFDLCVAWAYVALRVIHVVIHTGKNHVPTRMKVFAASLLLLLLLLGSNVYKLVS